VWDEVEPGRRGIHLRSADIDGSDQRRVYVSNLGFTTDLSLDRRGRRVAFAPCCRNRLPRLVVARVMGGRIWKPLARHPEFYFVGGIGWSPHGTRLVFDGDTDVHGRLAAGLWTVRLDGTGLRRLLQLPPPRRDQGPINEALAWTSRGILYCDRGALRIARHGHSRVLFRHAYSVHISGDGRHIVTEHFGRASLRQSIWYGDADGTHQRRLWRGPKASDSGVSLLEPVPDFHGRDLLVNRSSDPSAADDGLVAWRVAGDPADAQLQAFLSHADAYTWN